MKFIFNIIFYHLLANLLHAHDRWSCNHFSIEQMMQFDQLPIHYIQPAVDLDLYCLMTWPKNGDDTWQVLRLADKLRGYDISHELDDKIELHFSRTLNTFAYNIRNQRDNEVIEYLISPEHTRLPSKYIEYLLVQVFKQEKAHFDDAMRLIEEIASAYTVSERLDFYSILVENMVAPFIRYNEEMVKMKTVLEHVIVLNNQQHYRDEVNRIISNFPKY